MWTILKKNANFKHIHFSWYKSIRRATHIFHYLLIDTFSKYLIFFVKLNIFQTITKNETYLLMRFFAKRKLIKNDSIDG